MPVVLLVAYAAATLAIDQVVGPGGQAALGLVTAAVLVATCFEVIGSVSPRRPGCLRRGQMSRRRGGVRPV